MFRLIPKRPLAGIAVAVSALLIAPVSASAVSASGTKSCTSPRVPVTQTYAKTYAYHSFPLLGIGKIWQDSYFTNRYLVSPSTTAAWSLNATTVASTTGWYSVSCVL